MSAVSGFQTIETVTNASYVSGDILPSDIDFSVNTQTNNRTGTPAGISREIQVDFTTSVAGVLSVTYDGTTFFSINNGDTILGNATFTIFVKNTTLLNFSFSAGASIILTVSG